MLDEHRCDQCYEGGTDCDVDVAVQSHRADKGDDHNAGDEPDDACDEQRRAEDAHGIDGRIEEADQRAGCAFVRIPFDLFLGGLGLFR